MSLEESLIAVSVGALIGFVGSGWISWLERRAASRREIQRALGRYIGAASVVYARLQEMPPPVPPSVLDRLGDRLRGPQATWVAEQRSVRTSVGENWRDPVEELSRAYGQVWVLDLPEEVRSAVAHSATYLERLGETRTPELIGAWPEVHRQLIDAADILHGHFRKRRQVQLKETRG